MVEKDGATGVRGRMHSVSEEPVTSVLAGGDIPINDGDSIWDNDDEVLAALGYKPEFRREFTLWTTFCVSFAVLGLLPSFASTLYYGLGYAGTAGMSWGWLVSIVGVQAVASAMAELVCHILLILPMLTFDSALQCQHPVVCTMLQQSSRLQDGDHWLLGSQDGPTG